MKGKFQFNVLKQIQLRRGGEIGGENKVHYLGK